jgi:hypothetical protein
MVVGLVAGTGPALAQSGNPNFANNVTGRIVVSEYGKWAVTTQNAIVAGPATVNFAPAGTTVAVEKSPPTMTLVE